MFLQLRDMLMVFCLSKLNIILLKKTLFFYLQPLHGASKILVLAKSFAIVKNDTLKFIRPTLISFLTVTTTKE